MANPYVWIFNAMVFKVIPLIVFISLLLVAIVVIPLAIFNLLLYILDKWEERHD